MRPSPNHLPTYTDEPSPVAQSRSSAGPSPSPFELLASSSPIHPSIPTRSLARPAPAYGYCLPTLLYILIAYSALVGVVIWFTTTPRLAPVATEPSLHPARSALPASLLRLFCVSASVLRLCVSASPRPCDSCDSLVRSPSSFSSSSSSSSLDAAWDLTPKLRFPSST